MRGPPGECIGVCASFPRRRLRTWQAIEDHRFVQGIQTRESALVVETRRQGRGWKDRRVGDCWRQRAVDREARPRTNVRRPERPSPRRRDHGDYHARAGRQEPDWLARRDHLSRRTHGSVPLAGRIDTWLVVGGSWLVVTPLITNYQTGSNRSSPAYATNHNPQTTNYELRTTNQSQGLTD